MKKLLATLLVLMMTLCCTAAPAEDAGALSIGVPEMTITSTTTIDQEAFKNLLPLFGMDSSQAGIFDAILPVLNNLTPRITIAGTGFQVDLGLKGTDVISIAGQASEEGFVAGSTLIPSYLLTIKAETVQQLIEQYMQQAQSIMGSIDMEALTEKLTAYVTEYYMTLMGAISMSEPDKSQTYEFGGYTFNTMTKADIDVKAVAEATMSMVQKLKDDETIQQVISTLESTGMAVSMPSDEDLAVDEENLPTVDLTLYSNTDDEGAMTDSATFMNADITKNDTEEKFNVTLLMADSMLMTVQDEEDNVFTISFYADPETQGVNVSFSFEGNGASFGFVAAVNPDDAQTTIDSAIYFMNDEEPMIYNNTVIAQGGEITMDLSAEGKTVLAYEDLMQDSEGTLTGGLMGDLMGNGLGGVISKATEIMPDEINALMGLFGGAMVPAE